MLIETLQVIHRKQPFKPYKIHTSSGEWYRVVHPEGMMVFGSKQAIAVAVGDFDFNVIDMGSITEVAPLHPGSPQSVESD